MTIQDPSWPAPESVADCISLLTYAGVEAIKPAVNWLEANEPSHKSTYARAHRLLNEAGYLLEEALGVPDGTFGAGGTNKGGGGG